MRRDLIRMGLVPLAFLDAFLEVSENSQSHR